MEIKLKIVDFPGYSLNESQKSAYLKSLTDFFYIKKTFNILSAVKTVKTNILSYIVCKHSSMKIKCIVKL